MVDELKRLIKINRFVYANGRQRVHLNVCIGISLHLSSLKSDINIEHENTLAGDQNR